MLDKEPSNWRCDAKWISAILLVLAVALTVPAFTLSQLSRRSKAVPLIESVLRLAWPEAAASDRLVEATERSTSYAPSGRLEILPGLGTHLLADELAETSVDDALELVAHDLSLDVVERGTPAVIARLPDSQLGRQLESALEGSGARLARDAIVAELLPAGLADGRRIANWPLQAQQNPGQPVQPIVGVFVQVPVEELQGASARQIGERVASGVADVFLAEGYDAAAERVSNVNLRARLDAAISGPVPQRLQELFVTVLEGQRDTVAGRLEQARQVEQALRRPLETAPLVAGEEELAGLEPAEARALVLERLALRGYEEGSGALLQLLSGSEGAPRVAAVAGAIDALRASARDRYVRTAWLLAVFSLLLLAVLVLLSRGWGRLANPGISLLLAAAGGALLSVRISQLLSADGSAPAPTSPSSQGMAAYFLQLLAYAGTLLPEGVLELVVRNHLAVLVLGAALILLSLILRLAPLLGRRRRRLL